MVAWLQLSDVQCSVFYITLFMFQNLNNCTHPVYFRQSETGISKTILGTEDISGLSCLKKVVSLFVIEINCTIQSSIYSVFAPVSVRLLSVSKNLYNTMGGSRGGTLPPPPPGKSQGDMHVYLPRNTGMDPSRSTWTPQGRSSGPL